MNKKTFRLLPLTSALLLAGLAQQASAAGFQLIEQSASGMGNAYAGAAAVAEDASTTYFNPAGLTKITRPQMIFAGHIISTSADFEDKGSSVNPALTGGTVVPYSISPQGTANDDGGGVAFVPNFYYARPLNDKLVFGFGANAPFGLETDYDDDWVGRYHAINSAVQTVNLNPSLGYKVNDKLSIGGGISIQYIHAKLSSAIDSAAICLNALSGDDATCSSLGLGSGDVADASKDSKAELEADNVAFGFNFGMTYEVNDKTRIGASYRSGIEQKAEGDAKFTVNDNLAEFVLPGVNASLNQVGQALLQNSDVSATVDLPDSASFSITHQATPKVQLLADITWTGWSSFEELRIKYDSGQADSLTTEAWENTMRYSIGVNYDHTEDLRLRAGFAFDEEAIPDAEHRTPRIPGNDRTWIAFGAGYDYSDTIHFDVGFAHLFIDDTPSDHEDEGNGYHFRGEYKGDVNILSAQMNWNF